MLRKVSTRCRPNNSSRRLSIVDFVRHTFWIIMTKFLFKRRSPQSPMMPTLSMKTLQNRAPKVAQFSQLLSWFAPPLSPPNVHPICVFFTFFGGSAPTHEIRPERSETKINVAFSNFVRSYRDYFFFFFFFVFFVFEVTKSTSHFWTWPTDPIIFSRHIRFYRQVLFVRIVNDFFPLSYLNRSFPLPLSSHFCTSKLDFLWRSIHLKKEQQFIQSKPVLFLLLLITTNHRRHTCCAKCRFCDDLADPVNLDFNRFNPFKAILISTTTFNFVVQLSLSNWPKCAIDRCVWFMMIFMINKLIVPNIFRTFTSDLRQYSEVNWSHNYGSQSGLSLKCTESGLG